MTHTTVLRLCDLSGWHGPDACTLH